MKKKCSIHALPLVRAGMSSGMRHEMPFNLYLGPRLNCGYISQTFFYSIFLNIICYWLIEQYSWYQIDPESYWIRMVNMMCAWINHFFDEFLKEHWLIVILLWSEVDLTPRGSILCPAVIAFIGSCNLYRWAQLVADWMGFRMAAWTPEGRGFVISSPIDVWAFKVVLFIRDWILRIVAIRWSTPSRQMSCNSRINVGLGDLWIRFLVQIQSQTFCLHQSQFSVPFHVWCVKNIDL